MTTVFTPGPKASMQTPRNSPVSIQEKASLWVIIVSACLMALIATVLFIDFSQSKTWQAANLGILTAFAFVFCLGLIPTFLGRVQTRALIAYGVVSLVFLAAPALFTPLFILSSPFLLISSLFIASMLMAGSKYTTVTSVGIALAVAASLSDVFTPFFQVSSTPVSIIFGISLLGLIITFFILAKSRKLSFTLQSRLLIGGLAAVLIPVFLTTLIQVSQISQSFLNQTNQSLRFASLQAAGKMDAFLSSNRSAIARDSSLPAFINYISLPPNERSGSKAEADLKLTIETLKNRPQEFLSSYGLLDLRGMNIFDTNPVGVGRFETSRSYFQIPMNSKQTYVSDIEFSTLNGDPYIFFASPIINKDQIVIGVLRARFDALVFQRMAEQNTGLLGLRSYPILLDENFIRLADTITPNLIYKSVAPLSEGTLSALRDQKRLPDYPSDQLATKNLDLAEKLLKGKDNPYFTVELQDQEYDNVADSGAITYLSNKPWSMLYVQEQEILAQLLRSQIRLTTLFATLIAGAIGFAALIAARLLNRPILQLTSTAAQITAGNLDLTAQNSDQDEIGTLAAAFNLMTSRLRTMIRELEDRVRARTKELESQNSILMSQNQQIQTISEVARSIAAAQDLETLLDRVTNLISERFGFYHVGIFLSDEKNEFADLRAANSEGGKRMLFRQHKLRIGQVGIVGNVILKILICH
jgi:HAMP domain-containing protein